MQNTLRFPGSRRCGGPAVCPSEGPGGLARRRGVQVGTWSQEPFFPELFPSPSASASPFGAVVCLRLSGGIKCPQGAGDSGDGSRVTFSSARRDKLSLHLLHGLRCKASGRSLGSVCPDRVSGAAPAPDGQFWKERACRSSSLLCKTTPTCQRAGQAPSPMSTSGGGDSTSGRPCPPPGWRVPWLNVLSAPKPAPRHVELACCPCRAVTRDAMAALERPRDPD